MFANDILIAFFSVMCVLFALHLVSKRYQITRTQEERTAKDMQSLLQMKVELQSNADLCAQLVKQSETTEYFQTEVWDRYGGNFPLFYEELERAARCYQSFNEWNDRLHVVGKIEAKVIENGGREVEAVLGVVNDALGDLP